jgi:hypothetical protein
VNEREARRRAFRLFGPTAGAIKAKHNGSDTCMIGATEWAGMHVYGSGLNWEQAVFEAEIEAIDGSPPTQKFWFPMFIDITDLLEEDDMHTHGSDGENERD